MAELKKGVIDREIRTIVEDLVVDLKAGVDMTDTEQIRRLDYLCRRTGKPYAETLAYLKAVAATIGIRA